MNLKSVGMVDSAVMGEGLHSSITKFKFIVTLVVASNCVNYFASATRKLQLKEIDNMRGFTEINLVNTTLLSILSAIVAKHKDRLNQAEEKAVSINHHPSVLRSCRRQSEKIIHLQIQKSTTYELSQFHF